MSDVMNENIDYILEQNQREMDVLIDDFVADMNGLSISSDATLDAEQEKMMDEKLQMIDIRGLIEETVEDYNNQNTHGILLNEDDVLMVENQPNDLPRIEIATRNEFINAARFLWPARRRIHNPSAHQTDQSYFYCCRLHNA